MKTKKLIPKIFNVFYWAFFAGAVFSFVTLILRTEYTVRAFAGLFVCCLACVVFDSLEEVLQ